MRKIDHVAYFLPICFGFWLIIGNRFVIIRGFCHQIEFLHCGLGLGLELIRGLHNIRDRHKGCVLTIGKFDGVHLGHQAVLKKLIEKAKELDLPSAVMVFEPQPEEVFAPDKAPARLSRMRDKYEALKKLNIERLICVRFNTKFASQTAEYFIEHLLVEKLGVEFLVVGDDFRFGKGRKGDFPLLQEYGEKHQFSVNSTDSFCLEESRISSSAIRKALADDQLSLASSMLGRPFNISGKVVHGQKLGRSIGFPTANVLLNRCQSPVKGVYAVQVAVGEQLFNGVANVGSRPTVNGERAQLEVNVFDFQQDLYGKYINVLLREKIRNEQKFDGVDALKAQIAKDVEQARNWFMRQ